MIVYEGYSWEDPTGDEDDGRMGEMIFGVISLFESDARKWVEEYCTNQGTGSLRWAEQFVETWGTADWDGFRYLHQIGDNKIVGGIRRTIVQGTEEDREVQNRA